MKAGFSRVCLLTLALLAGFVTFSEPSQTLHWRRGARRVDAEIHDWSLHPLLARISASSGWKIYVEPGLDEKISVTFSNAPQGDALKLLLGRLNYALIPNGRGRSKLFVYKTSLGQATALVKPDAGQKPTNWLAKEIILTLPPGSKLDAEKLATELNGKIVAKSEGLNAYRLEFADADAAQKAREALAQREDLDAQDNYSFQRPTLSASASSSPAAMFPVDPTPVSRGDQVTVALVDTPIQTLDGKMQEFVLPSVHVLDQPSSLPNDPTHATSMAETVLNSMAFTKDAGNPSKLGNVRVLPIDIYGNSDTTSTFEVAQGLYKAIQANAQVVNLSLGGTGDSPMVDYLLEMAKQKQIMVFASAGNTPTTDPTWPAANPNVVAVTATDWTGNIAPYANRGSFVDVKAPGTSRIYYNGQAYVSTGTSTATAFVSGQAAGLAAQGFSPAQTEEAILKNFNMNSASAPVNGRTK